MADLLNERTKTHGDFVRTAAFTADMEAEFWDGNERSRYSRPQQVALSQIFVKLGRIAAGDPNHVDHWDDIAGYAKLAADSIRG